MKNPSPDELALFLTQLPNEPGVYRLLNEEGLVLYVGKASNLKKRVNSYFNKQQTSPKTLSLVNQIKSIEISVTRSETEALLLESNLIKSLRPKYNVLLRDDKSYPYIHISTHPDFPGIGLYRAKKKPTSGYFFGPYPSTQAVRETIITIQKVFKIRNCRDSYFNARTRPCLQYQIKRCSAPCVLYITPAEYQHNLKDAIRFLQGKSQHVLDSLTLKMEAAVRDLKFEEAAVLRDQIKHLRLVQEQQGMLHLQGDADAIAIEAEPGFAAIQCVSIRDGQILSSNAFFPSVPHQSFDDKERSPLWQQTFEAFIGFYYLENPSRIPALILCDHRLLDHRALEDALSERRGKPCTIKIKPRGPKARWLDFALNNLRLSLNEYERKRTTMTSRYEALEQLLSLANPIKRMECFDISHTQGEATIAACVVFDAFGPCNKEYRRFTIENIAKGDDYAAMEQVLRRRFKRLLETNSLPDVVIIDGGKGQVTVALNVLSTMKIENITLLGVAKDPSRKAGLEKIIRVNPYSEIHPASDSKALHLLQHIRDEAHRFAITAHRKKRHKTRLRSSLEDIEGIGPKRRKALLQRFGGLRDLAKAPLQEIAKVQGISTELAMRIYQCFH